MSKVDEILNRRRNENNYNAVQSADNSPTERILRKRRANELQAQLSNIDLSDVSSYLQNGGYADNKTLTSYLKKLNTFSDLYSQYGDNGGAVDNEYSKDLKSARDSLLKARNVYSQFSNKDEYTRNYNYYNAENNYKDKTYKEIKSLYERGRYTPNEKEWFENTIQGNREFEYDSKFVKNNSDFNKYSKKGAEIKNPTDLEANSWSVKIKNNVIGGKDIGNIVTYSRDNYVGIVLGSNKGNEKYGYMTDDEVNIYNYYLAKENDGLVEKGTSQKYLDDLENKLNMRKGKMIADSIKDYKSLVFASVLPNGFKQFAEGKNIFNTKDDYIAPSEYQYASSMIRENGNLNEVEKVIYDLGLTTSNMLPSILASSLSNLIIPGSGKVVGPVLMGGSASGNAYQEMLNLGYDKAQARVYSTITGTLESTLQYLLGGIGKLGGKLSGHAVEKFTKGINSAVAKFAIKYAGEMASEGLEEGLQEILSPIVKHFVTGDDFEGIDWEATAYSALLGSLSAGAINGVTNVADYASRTVANKDFYSDFTVDMQKDLVKEVLESTNGTQSKAYAEKLNNKLKKGKELSANQMDNLINAKEEEFVDEDNQKIKNSVKERLLSLGENENIDTLADIVTKKTLGEKLSYFEMYQLKQSSSSQRVINELNIDNINSGNYTSDWTKNIGTERLNDSKYNNHEENEHSSYYDNLKDALKTYEIKNYIENVFSDYFDDDFSDIDDNTNNKVNISEDIPEVSKVVSDDKGNIEYKLKDGTTVDSKDIQFKNDTQATLYKTAEEFGYDAPTTNVIVSAYSDGIGLTPEEFMLGTNQAYNYGKALFSQKYIGEDTLYNKLPKHLQDFAYNLGIKEAQKSDKTKLEAIKNGANGKKGRKKGILKSENVSLKELQIQFNDTQHIAYKVLSTIADVTGIDIVLYKSTVDSNGNYKGVQGKFKHNDNTVCIDVNSGLSTESDISDLGKYAMLRTFIHEFLHFIEKMNPLEYNELREVVFSSLTENGVNVRELIEEKMSNKKLDFNSASREVVAEALADILPDSKFIPKIVNENKLLAKKLKYKLVEFLNNIKEYFKGLGYNRSVEANALKKEISGEIHYLEKIVEMFDKSAIGAVKNYQSNFAVDEEIKQTPKNTEKSEELTNGKENVNNKGTVQQPVEYGQGDSRLVDEQPLRDVQGISTGKQSLPEADVKRSGTGRDDTGFNAGTGDSRSNRNGESGVSVLSDNNTASKDNGNTSVSDDTVTETKKEESANPVKSNEKTQADEIKSQKEEENTSKINEVEKEEKKKATEIIIEEKIKQQSTKNPKGDNFIINDSLNLPKGEKAKFKANVEALTLIKKLEKENRIATAEEQIILSKYVGWGGLDDAFGEYAKNPQTGKYEIIGKNGWEKEFSQLKKLVDDGVITKKEYEDMKSSTKNAHFTSIEVIKGIYNGLRKIGFKGGRMLEPSSGVGNFVGAMPTDLSSGVTSWTMVELDRITGQIAKYLYPNVDVHIQGFEKTILPDDYIDVAIGNVPFGNYGVVDKTYPKRLTKSIHNYFFAKSIDKVRPGGIVMFITSQFTMDAENSDIRKYMSQKADLIGAIRLPNNAFTENAGTKVVSDILIFKKRKKGAPYSGESFVNSNEKKFGEGYYDKYNINEYFDKHPEMVLGTTSISGGMYGKNSVTVNPLKDKGTLEEQITKAFDSVNYKMDYKSAVSADVANSVVHSKNSRAKQNCYTKDDKGNVYRTLGSTREKITDTTKTAKISMILDIKKAYNDLIYAIQQGKKSDVTKFRKELNEAYDSFVKKFKCLNSANNKSLMLGDPDYYSILALEKYDSKSKIATKADIFSKDTIKRTVVHKSAENIEDAIIISMNTIGNVDVGIISKLLNKPVEDIAKELIDGRLAYKQKDGSFELPEKYLSGNVRAKLKEAELMLSFDKDFKNNVEDLKTVIPKDIPYNDISVSPGSPWIPNEIYADFITEMLGGYNRAYSPDVIVGKIVADGSFTIKLNNQRLKYNTNNTSVWGTSRKTFLDIMEALMCNSSLTVYDTIKDGSSTTRILNQQETALAQEKAEKISQKFTEWLWENEDRRNQLATLYNETFNAFVPAKYNGEHLTLNGLNESKYTLRQHQSNAVQRIVSSGGNTLLAHAVGAGKTLEMASAAMKLKQLGVIKKPVFVVPKNLVSQWGGDFIDAFPIAKLLVTEDTQFKKENRKVFINQIMNGDFDAIIMSYEQFASIQMSPEYQIEFVEKQIDEYENAIITEKLENGSSPTIKQLEKAKEKLRVKLQKLMDSKKDTDNTNFESLGIDSIFVDEAHNFKNLAYVSKMKNVSGLGNQQGNQKTTDLLMKVRYLQSLNNGRGIVFATATPVMNSMAEMFTMQKYLQPDILNQLGIQSFDAWAKQFGEVVTQPEIKPSGTGYRIKQSFSKFKNLAELQVLFRGFTDVITKPPGLKVPKMKGGKVKIVECEAGEFQKEYMKNLEKRADNVKNVDSSVDNMLVITSDGRKVSYTQRMIDPSLPYEEGCKIVKCCENIYSEYIESNANKGTQIVFCDLGIPKSESSKTDNSNETDDNTESEGVNLYKDMRDILVDKGIPKNEIAFIHEANNDKKRFQLFDDVNEGKVRVLIGSTGKMGVGMNAQKKAVAIHHLDAPWRPGDVEQRDGRVFRQKNENAEVSKYVYVTKGTFDSRLWDIIDRKQYFIGQVMNGEDVGRTAEDTGEVTLSAAEVKAIASGDPLILEEITLKNEVQKLENLQKAYNSNNLILKEKRMTNLKLLADTVKRIENGKTDIENIVDTFSEDKFNIKINGTSFTDTKEAGTFLYATITEKVKSSTPVKVGSFSNFDIMVSKVGEEYKGFLLGKGAYPFNVYPVNKTKTVTNIANIVKNLEDTIKGLEENAVSLQNEISKQDELIKQPFEYADELNQKRKKHEELMDKLSHKDEQRLVDDEGVQNQDRISPLTDREILEYAANEISITDLSKAEISSLNIFKSHLEKLKSLQEKRTEQGKLYKEQQFGSNPDKNEAIKTLNRMKILDTQIERESKELLSIEDKQILKTVLQKSRKKIESVERQKAKENLSRWRDRRNNTQNIKKYRERIEKDVSELQDWVLHPSNKDALKHIPEVIKSPVISFLNSIDFSSKRKLNGGANTKKDEIFINKLKKLATAVNDIESSENLYSGYSYLPEGFMQKLNAYISTAEGLARASDGEYIINKMTSQELKDLSEIVTTLKKFITEMNRFQCNSMFSHVYEAGESTIDELSSYKNATNNYLKARFNSATWKHLRPAQLFERIGGAAVSIYKELVAAQSQLGFNGGLIKEFCDKTYTKEEAEEWKKTVKEFYIDGKDIKMPISYIMGLKLLYKQEDSRRHILADKGGFRVATFKQGNTIQQSGIVRLEKEDIETIIKSLDEVPRAKEVAEKLQKFMATQGAEWGNYVSMIRFGIKQFINPEYYPIRCDSSNFGADRIETPEYTSVYALLNMGFTKARNEEASNPIVVYDIFDVFTNHMTSMAQYNAFALPIIDALKWLNYKSIDVDHITGSKVINNSVREELSRVFGAKIDEDGKSSVGFAENFILNIIKAINGTEMQGASTDSIGLNALHKYNMAQIAYNVRVVVQQPLSVIRSATVLNPNSVLLGMKQNPKEIKNNIKEMYKYSGIAIWKGKLGFYDVNISRGMKKLITQESNLIDKVGEVGMHGAEKADELTWSAMWNACKIEVKRRQNGSFDITKDYEKVSKLFDEVIYKTQVVDSVLTKSEYMRSKGFFAKTSASFMSEGVTTVSMVMETIDKYNADIQKGLSKRQAWVKNKKNIVRTFSVYGVSAIMLSVVQSIVDTLRDDDEDKEFGEKYYDNLLGNFIDELLPFGELPIINDFYDLSKELLSKLGVDTYGNPPQSVYMQWYNSLVKGTEIIMKKINSEPTNYTVYAGISKLLQAVAGMSGLPFGTASREIITSWNSTAGAIDKNLKVQTYISGDEKSYLIFYNMEKDNAEYFKKLRSECKDDTEYNSALKKAIFQQYEDSKIDLKTAENYLKKYCKLDDDDIYWMIDKWNYRKEKGSAEGYAKYDDFFKAVETGKNIKAVIKTYMDNGVEKSTLASQITAHYKPQYVEMTTAEKTKIKGYLLNAYVLLGYDRAKKSKEIDKWKK